MGILRPVGEGINFILCLVVAKSLQPLNITGYFSDLCKVNYYMVTKLIRYSICAFFIIANPPNSGAQEYFSVKGSIGRSFEGQLIIIENKTFPKFHTQQRKVKESALIKDGKFVLYLLAKEAQYYVLSIPDRNLKTNFFLTPNDTRINIFDSLLQNIVVENPGTAEFQSFELALKKVKYPPRLVELENVDNKHLPDSQRNIIRDSMMILEDTFYKNLSVEAFKWNEKNIGSALVSYSIYTYMREYFHDSVLMSQLKRSGNLSRNNVYGKEVKYILDNFSIGRKFPSLKVIDSLSRIRNLRKYKGNIVLLDFWASWCRPCINQIPELKSLNRLYQTYPFQLISLSLDTDATKWKMAVAAHKLLWPQFIGYNKETFSRNLGIKTIPANFILNGEGIIIAKNLWGAALEDFLSGQLKILMK